MSKKKTRSNFEKRRQEKGLAPNRDSQMVAGGGLHQVADGSDGAVIKKIKKAAGRTRQWDRERSVRTLA